MNDNLYSINTGNVDPGMYIFVICTFSIDAFRGVLYQSHNFGIVITLKKTVFS